MLFFTFSDDRTESKYRSLYALHEKPMLLLARKILKDQGHAEDVVQECFLELLANEKLMQKLHDPTSSATKSYLMMMVKSRSINLYHKIKKHQDSVMEIDEDLLYKIGDENADVEKILANAEMAFEVKQYLNLLDPMDVNIITLKYYEGLQNTQIADLLKIDSNLVGVRIYRAKEKLAAEIQKRKQQEEVTISGRFKRKIR